MGRKEGGSFEYFVPTGHQSLEIIIIRRNKKAKSVVERFSEFIDVNLSDREEIILSYNFDTETFHIDKV